MKQIRWSLATVFTLGVATALAQQPGGRGGLDAGGTRRPPPIIEALDADHDHVISADELKNATALLKTLDKNNDGKLTEDEFRGPAGGPGPSGPDGGPPPRGGRGFESNPRRGERPDREREGHRNPGAGQEGRPGGDPDAGPPPPSPERMVEHAMEFDADKDGKLSKDELLKFAVEFEKHRPRPGRPPGAGEGPNDGGSENRQRPQRPE